MEATMEDVGVRAMRWIAAVCPTQKPKKARRIHPNCLSGGVQPNTLAGHKLVLSVLTDAPQSPRDISRTINRSLNRTETILRQLAEKREVKVIPGRPVRYAKRV